RHVSRGGGGIDRSRNYRHHRVALLLPALPPARRPAARNLPARHAAGRSPQPRIARALPMAAADLTRAHPQTDGAQRGGRPEARADRVSRLGAIWGMGPKTCARCGKGFQASGREYSCPECKSRGSPNIRLSNRERQIAELIAAAKSNKEIAFEL